MRTISTTVLSVILILFISCSKDEPDTAPEFDQTASLITSFMLNKSEAKINSDNNTIHLAVPALSDINNATPKINISQGATVSPASLETVDLSQPVVYTVTADDGSKKEYTVTGEKLVDTAFLIVDMQNAAFDNPNFAIYNTTEICQCIGAVVDKARNTNIKIVYAQATSESVPEGSPGWQVVSMLAPEDEDILVLKLESNSFENSELQNELTDIGVGVVIMCGVATDQCIDNTFRGAKIRKYDILMLADGHSTKDPDAQETIDTYNSSWASQGAAVLSSDEINF